MTMLLQYPVDQPATITQTYAEHLAHYRPGYNPGLDFAVEIGSAIYAAGEGTVTWIEQPAPEMQGYGAHVRIQHIDGLMTIYAHLSQVDVAVGDHVQAGRVIGISGNTGNSTGPHLHFECRLWDTPIDPLPLISGEEQVAVGLGSLPMGLPVATVLVDLSVREAPAKNARYLKTVKPGNCIPVIGASWIYVTGRQRPDLWLCIGHQQWVCALYDGNVFSTVEGHA